MEKIPHGIDFNIIKFYTIIKDLTIQKGIKYEGTRNEDESVEKDWLPMVVFFS